MIRPQGFEANAVESPPGTGKLAIGVVSNRELDAGWSYVDRRPLAINTLDSAVMVTETSLARRLVDETRSNRHQRPQSPFTQAER
jgi:hypothetical protein